MEGFTRLAENLIRSSCALLNTYLTEMSEIAFRFGGTVDKVIGDSIMVFLVTLKAVAPGQMPSLRFHGPAMKRQ